MKQVETFGGQTKIYELVNFEEKFTMTGVPFDFRIRLTQKLDEKYNLGHYNYVIEIKEVSIGNDPIYSIVTSMQSTGAAANKFDNDKVSKIIMEFQKNFRFDDIKFAG